MESLLTLFLTGTLDHWVTVHRERCRIRGFAHGHQRRRFTSASRLLSLLHWLGGRRYQWQTAYVGGRIPPQILGHRDTCPVKGALIGKQISLALRPLLHQLDSADEEKPRCGSSKQLLPCRSPCDLPGPAPSALTRRCSSTCTGDTRKSARGRRIRPDRIRRVTGTCQSRCTADDFLNVVGNSTLEDRVGGIADMG